MKFEVNGFNVFKKNAINPTLSGNDLISGKGMEIRPNPKNVHSGRSSTKAVPELEGRLNTSQILTGKPPVTTDKTPNSSYQDCGRPTVPQHVNVLNTNTTYGSTATLSCQTGYILRGSGTVMCGSNGHWNITDQPCTPVDCGRPTVPQHVNVLNTNTTYGSTATLSCQTGYILQGSGTVMCGSNGHWNITNQPCSPVDCGRPTVPQHVNVLNTNTTYGSTAVLSCQTGYILQGSGTVMCGSNGHWNITDQPCSPVEKSPCLSKEGVAIVVPVRDREEHLRVFIKEIVPFIQVQNISFHIFIIEQSQKAAFNRAKLFNIGYNESKSVGNFSCFIFHDVDLIPTSPDNLYCCDRSPKHMAVGNEKFSFKITSAGLKIVRPSVPVGRYKALEHYPSKASEDRWKLLHSAAQRMTKDGINTLNYTLLAKKSDGVTTHIMADIDTVQEVNTLS